jgi:replicative DNA helicase
MHHEGIALDPIMLTNRLREQGKLEIIGGAVILTEIYGFIQVPSHAKWYLDKVVEDFRLRQELHAHLLSASECFKHRTHGSTRSVDETLNHCDAIVQVMREGNQAKVDTSATLSQCLSEHVDHMQILEEAKQSGKSPLIRTGFPTLDRKSGGIGYGETWLITGPTKAGKSVICGNIVKHAAEMGNLCKIYTNEVSRVAYTGRLLASESDHFDGSIERHGFINRRQMEEYSKAVRELQDRLGRLIDIDNAQGKYVEDIIADMRQQAKRGVTMVVVDLIGKVMTRRNSGVREQDIAYMSNRLSDAAATLNMSLALVSQENDNGDVRESRSLAFDCSAWLQIQHVITKEKKVGMFGGSKEAEKRDETRRDLFVRLARGFGSGDVIHCYFDGPRFLIREIDERYENTNP